MVHQLPEVTAIMCRERTVCWQVKSL